MSENTIDIVSLVSEADDHLEFARSAAQRGEFSDEALIGLEAQFARVEDRRRDEYLYVAVVGEFSSGKSTFINALLRDDLLEASALVTTACATYIRHAKGLEASARSVRSPSTKSKINKSQPVKTVQAGDIRCRSDRLEDIRDFIKMTSIAGPDDGLTELVVGHPAEFLGDEIVIIDTPGLSAENAGHEEIAIDVVEHRADVAVVVIPADYAMQASLRRFLLDLTGLYLHRCVFVITKMARLKERDRAAVIAKVQGILGQEFNLPEPPIFACDPQAVIDDMLETADSDAAFWVNAFEDLKSEIIKRLRQERALSITESVLRLLTRTFDQLKEHLAQRASDYAAFEAALAREVIQDVDGFGQGCLTEAQARGETAARTLTKSASDRLQQLRKDLPQTVRKAVMSMKTPGGLSKTLNEDGAAAKRMSEEIDKAVKDLERLEKKFDREITTAAKKLDQSFSSAYGKLERIRGDRLNLKLPGPTGVAKPKALDALDLARAGHKEDQDNDAARKFWLAVGGGALALALFSPIAIIFGLIGGRLLAGKLTPSLKDQKQAAWAKIEPRLSEQVDHIDEALQKRISNRRQSHKKSLKARVAAHSDIYREAAAKLTREQTQEAARLSGLRERVERDLAELDRRRDQLDRQRERLASFGMAPNEETLSA